MSWEERRKYRACDSDSRRMSIRLEMQSQALDDLISGKLMGWGFREGAPPEDGPSLIPAHLFPRDADDTAAIDWQSSALKSSSHAFVRIRVAKPARTTRPRKQTKGSTTGKPQPPTSAAAVAPPSLVEPKLMKKKSGRPRVDEPLRAVVRSLVKGRQLKDKSRKEQIEVIRAAARAAHTTLFLRETQPSRDKIFAALRAEGLIGPRE
jgi:hypothetical protein